MDYRAAESAGKDRDVVVSGEDLERSRLRLLLFLGGLALGPLTFATLTTSVIPLVGELSGHYGVSQATASLIVIVALIAGAVATPLLGRLADLHGKRRMLLVTLSLLLAGCALAAVTDSFGLLLVARVLQGTGCAAIPLGYAVIADTVPASRRNFSLGLLSATSTAGGGLGFVFGGSMVAWTGSVQSMFAVLALVAAAALVATARLVAPSKIRASGRMDLVGATLLAVGLTGCLVALSEGGAWGWNAPATMLFASVGIVGIAAWTVHGRRARDPLVDTRMFFSRRMVVGSVSMLALGSGAYTLMLCVVVIAQADPAVAGYGLGLGSIAAPALLIPSCVAQVAMAMSLSPVARRLGLRGALVLGAVITAAGLLAVASLHNSIAVLVVLTVVCSIGFGLLASASPAYVVSMVGQTERGVAAGMNFICRTAGQALGTATVAAAVTVATPLGSAVPALAGYTTALQIGAGLALVAAAVALVPAVRAKPPVPVPAAPTATVG